MRNTEESYERWRDWWSRFLSKNKFDTANEQRTLDELRGAAAAVPTLAPIFREVLDTIMKRHNAMADSERIARAHVWEAGREAY